MLLQINTMLSIVVSELSSGNGYHNGRSAGRIPSREAERNLWIIVICNVKAFVFGLGCGSDACQKQTEGGDARTTFHSGLTVELSGAHAAV